MFISPALNAGFFCLLCRMPSGFLCSVLALFESTSGICLTGMHIYMITGVVVSTDMEMVNDLFMG